MATRTIANGGGNWDALGTWVEGAVPTSADEVVATATSGNLTINVAAGCRSIDLTGYVGTVTHNSGVTLTIGDATDPTGNNALIFPSSGWTYTLGNVTSSSIAFARTSGTALNINPGGKAFGNTTFGSAASGSWKLTGNLLGAASTTPIVFTRGTFDANGYNVDFGILSSTNTNTRSIVMGSGTWTLSGGGGATMISIVTATNLTFTPGNPIVFSYSGSTGTRTVTIATSLPSAAAPSFNITGGSDTVNFGSSPVKDVNFTGFTGTAGALATVYGNITFGTGMTAAGCTFKNTSGTKTLTSNGVSMTTGVTINGSGGTVQLADALATVGITRTAGTFVDAGFGVNVSGNWTNTAGAGAFTLTGTTTLDKTSGTQTIAGSTTFTNLVATAAAARTITFTDGTTQTVTNSLTLTGSSGQLLTLGGSSTGGWTLAVPATQSLGYLSVSRSTATGNTALAGSTSTDGGNNTNWNFGPPVPVTSTANLMLLGVG